MTAPAKRTRSRRDASKLAAAAPIGDTIDRLISQAAAAASTFPTFDEIPRRPHGTIRSIEAYLSLALLPRDDTVLRAAAVKLFLVDERLGNESKTEGLAKEHREMLFELSATHATTSGGIAWKLAKVLGYFAADDDDDTSPWWRSLLRSALCDAVELERARHV